MATLDAQVESNLEPFRTVYGASAIRRRDEAALEETTMELLQDGADTPEEVVLKKDRSAQVRRCLAQMSREHREVIDLVYYHEKSIEEVADIIRAPKNTVNTRMFYARKRLAGLLSHHCDFDYLAAPEAAYAGHESFVSYCPKS
jgi:RNA polymerase sigma factor (sigma-70 family)